MAFHDAKIVFDPHIANKMEMLFIIIHMLRFHIAKREGGLSKEPWHPNGAKYTEKKAHNITLYYVLII